MSHSTPRRSTSSLVKIGNDDPTLTGHAGLLLTGELVRRLQPARRRLLWGEVFKRTYVRLIC